MEADPNQPRRSMRLVGVKRTYTEATTPGERKEDRRRQAAKKYRKDTSKDIQEKASKVEKDAVWHLENAITNVAEQITANQNAAEDMQMPASKFTKKAGLSSSNDAYREICYIAETIKTAAASASSQSKSKGDDLPLANDHDDGANDRHTKGQQLFDEWAAKFSIPAVDDIMDDIITSIPDPKEGISLPSEAMAANAITKPSPTQAKPKNWGCTLYGTSWV